MTRRLTQILVVVTFVALVIYDLLIRVEPTPDDTISAVIWSWVTEHPTVAALLGVVLGHWVWPPRKRIPEIGPYVLIVWGIIVAACDWFGLLPSIPPLASFGTGLVLGGLLWGPTHDDVKGTGG
jgi:hypothetical protein